MTETISLIDRGRGLQLSTSRITVMDLVQYFRRGCSAEEIQRWIPSLSQEEISVVEGYYRDHAAELEEADDRVQADRNEQIRRQREQFPDLRESPEQARARFKKRLPGRPAERRP